MVAQRLDRRDHRAFKISRTLCHVHDCRRSREGGRPVSGEKSVVSCCGFAGASLLPIE